MRRDLPATVPLSHSLGAGTVGQTAFAAGQTRDSCAGTLSGTAAGRLPPKPVPPRPSWWDKIWPLSQVSRLSRLMISTSAPL